MTNDQLEAIYKENAGVSHLTALRMIYNHGWYDGKGQTPTANSADQSKAASAPAAIIKATRRID